jgi:hypothetical protein
MWVARAILVAVGTYGLVGLLFGVGFAVWGAPRLDPAVRGSSPFFRLLILPASAALWPLMLVQWAKSGGRGEAR